MLGTGPHAQICQPMLGRMPGEVFPSIAQSGSSYFGPKVSIACRPRFPVWNTRKVNDPLTGLFSPHIRQG